MISTQENKTGSPEGRKIVSFQGLLDAAYRVGLCDLLLGALLLVEDPLQLGLKLSLAAPRLVETRERLVNFAGRV